MQSNQLNSYLEVKNRTNRDVRQLGPIVSQQYGPVESTASQTVINLSFAVANTAEGKRSVLLFVDGKLLSEGASNDYQFTNVSNGTASQITLNSPIAAGLNILALKLGAYMEEFPNPSSVQATLNNDVGQPLLMAQAGFQNFVQKAFVTAPNTQIQNRAQVESGSLKGIAGIERIPFKSITLIKNEFGPNGETVYELDSKDTRIRFVGIWADSTNAAGNQIFSASNADFMEVTFYGTGLNILGVVDGQVRDTRATVDGGAEGANFNLTGSNILNARNYNQNIVQTATSGLSLGWHTVKIRQFTSVPLQLFGIEILNERTNLAVLAGTAYGGTKRENLASLSTSSFSAGVAGNRGARIVKYIKDGVISQAVQEVNGAAAYLTSTDHTNEEVTRKINGREFGVNRADDFSTLASVDSARTFTLDDGTTTLVLSSGKYNNDYSGDNIHTAASGFMIITFVGTGLDIITRGDSLLKSYSVSVDGGASVGTISWQSSLPSYVDGVIKICSGLPYGTHTVRLTNTAGVRGFGISNFLIYQPKKPSIPSGAVELSDYNLMANYTLNNTPNPGISGRLSQGVLRKMTAARETIFSGTWTLSLDTGFASGLFNRTTTAGNYAEYTFYGTGVDIRLFIGNGTNNFTFSIDGSSNLSGFTSSFNGAGTGLTYTASTGTLSGTAAGYANYDTGVFSVSGLSLGKHTIRVTQNAAIQLCIDTFDIITPIHINSSSLKIGSLSLNDTRKFSPIVDKPETIDLSKAKAWLYFDAANSKILSSMNISAVLNVATGRWLIYFEKPFKDSNFVCVASSGLVDVSVATAVGYRGPNFQRIETSNTAGTFGNDYFNVVFFGELEDETEK